MLFDVTNDKELESSVVGGKAYNLHVLSKAGFPVPPAVVITVDPARDIHEQLSKTDLSSRLQQSIKYAVRSSGVGEDSVEKSWAGIFDSYLFVEHNDVFNRVKDVLDFSATERYLMYSTLNDSQIDSMAVVVQEMIDPDFAGVAFTSNPIENDKRACIIEIVKGVGSSLVSGERTPTTLRVNKLTGIYRIMQNGYDVIPEGAVEHIVGKLMPHLSAVEEFYGMPMDVEWALTKNDDVYLLQARPIVGMAS